MEENNNPIAENSANNNVEKKISTPALISFIFSLVGLIIAGLPCGIVAIITGIVGLVKYNAETQKCKWMAIVGLIVGALDVILVVVSMIAAVTMFGEAMSAF